MTASPESWLEVQLAPAEDAALEADLSNRLAEVLGWLYFFLEQPASTRPPLSEAMRGNLIDMTDRSVEQLTALLQEAKTG